MATAGKTLKVERVRAGVTKTALGKRMGLTRQSLWVLEKAAEVAPTRVAQYRAALAALRDANETPREDVA